MEDSDYNLARKLQDEEDLIFELETEGKIRVFPERYIQQELSSDSSSQEDEDACSIRKSHIYRRKKEVNTVTKLKEQIVKARNMNRDKIRIELILNTNRTISKLYYGPRPMNVKDILKIGYTKYQKKFKRVFTFDGEEIETEFLEYDRVVLSMGEDYVI